MFSTRVFLFHRSPVPALMIAFAAACAPGSAPAAKDPFERVMPVPSGEPIPVFDFFRPPLLTSPQVNEAGTHLAAIVTSENDRQVLLVVDLDSGQFDRLSGASNKDVYRLAWLDDHRILFGVSKDKLYSSGLYVADARNLVRNHAVELHNATQLIGVPRTSRLRPIIWIQHNAYNSGNDGGVVQINALQRVNPKFETAVYIDHGSLDYGTMASVVRSFPTPSGGRPVGYLSDKDGELAFASTFRDGFAFLHYLEGATWMQSPLDLDEIEIVGAGERPGELLVLGPRRPDKPRMLHLADARTGDLGEPVLEDDRYDFDGWPHRHAVDGRILGFKYNRSMLRTLWLDEGLGKLQALLETRFPNMVVNIFANDAAGKSFFFSTVSDRQPIGFHRVNLETREVGLIKNSRPWIDPERMRPMSVVTFNTRDGRKLEGYLTLPDGASKASPAPLVVLPHGGPWVRDTWGWDREAQFLASRGYAVWQPNYRGSTGYDWMFPESDRWEFRKMHEDVTDSVQRLIRSGLVDPDRMAIMGTSFGGYLALSGAVHEPDLYRCAVTVAGIFDWSEEMRTARRDRFASPEYDVLMRRLGDPKAQEEKFEEISPSRHLDRVKVPVFIAHGAEDRVVVIEQSKSIAAGLKQRGVPVTTLFVSREGHGMSATKNEVELYTRIEAFLAQNLAAR